MWNLTGKSQWFEKILHLKCTSDCHNYTSTHSTLEKKKTTSHPKFKSPWSVHLYPVPREGKFLKRFLLNHFYSTVKSKNFVREDTGWKITLTSMGNDKFEEKIFNSGVWLNLNMTQQVSPIRTWAHHQISLHLFLIYSHVVWDSCTEGENTFALSSVCLEFSKYIIVEYISFYKL